MSVHYRTVAVVLAAMMLLSALPIAAITASGSSTTTQSTSSSANFSVSKNGVTSVYHKITTAEISALESQLGVRVDGTNYNVIIDGHSTGLAPMSASEYASLSDYAYTISEADSASSYASSLDLSASVYFPAVGDQGSLGSCAAWAMTYYCYGYQEAVDQGWSQAKAGASSQLLSPSFTYNRVSDYNSGSSLYGNARVICDSGVATLATMPYTVKDYITWGDEVAMRDAVQHRASTYVFISSATTDMIKSVLQSGSPVTFALDGNAFTSAFSGDGTSKIISSADYSSTALNHAQTIVGWDDTVSEDGDVGAFRVVNSWGTDFAESGYYWITYAAMAKMLAVTTPVYITDKADYQPQILAALQFSSLPIRDMTISFTLCNSVTGTTVATRSLYYRTTYSKTAPSLPEVLIVDLTDFATSYSSTNNKFVVTFSGGTVLGQLALYRLEWYEGGYTAGFPTQKSANATGLPGTTSGTYSLTFTKYTQISLASALDTSSIAFSTSGQAGWTSVIDTSYSGGDAVQSGIIGNSHYSKMSAVVTGPMTLSYYWKVSSQSGADYLNCSLDSVVKASISGETAWSKVSNSIPSGSHTLEWNYSKSSSTFSGLDCGYVDLVATTGGSTDSTAPVTTATVTGTAGTDSWYTSTIGIALAASDSETGVLSTKYKLDSGSWTTYSSSISITAEGSHTLQYYSTDNSGNVETTKSLSVKKDSVAPTTTSAVSSYTVTLTRSDATSGVASTKYRIDGGSWTTYSTSFVVGTSGHSHLVEYYSVDNAGNTESVKQVTVGTADTTAPTSSIALSGTQGGNQWYTSAVSISLSATDDSSGVAATYYKVDSGSWTTYASAFSISTDGTHTVQYYSVDVIGNVESTAIKTVKIDRTSPTSTASLSGDEVTITASDATSGLSLIQYSLDGSSYITYTGAIVITDPTVAHTLTYRAVDLAGNVESQNSLDVPIRNDVVFEAPSAPLDMQADVVGNNIQLSWQVPSSNGNATILGYYLYKSSGSGYVKLATVTGLEYSDSSIVLGTTYSYYVTAYNAVGEGQASSPVSMQFVSLPSPPSGLTASVTNGEIVLTWSAPSNTGGLPIQNYILVRNSAVGEERTQLAADIVRFEDSSVVEGQTYQYTLYSINAMGQSASGASATIKVPYQMSEPAYLKATLTDNEVVLQWSAPNGSVPTAYIIKRSLGSFSAQSTILATVTELAYVDSDLAAGTTYCYRVYAVYGEEVGPAAQASVTLPNELPSVPTGLTATVTGNGSMLTWSLADASGQGVTGYHIYRLAQGGSAPTLLAETSELSYLDNAVQAGTNYSYWVAAVNDAGEGARAGPALAVIPAIVETAPSAPQSLQYQVDGDLLLLSWSAPVTAGTSEILGYRVYRSLENSSMALIAIVKASNFTDSTTVSGQDYRYWVCAYNNAGNGAMAGPLAFVRAVQQVYDPTVPESLTASNSEGYVTLTWSAASGDVIGYNIYCGNGTDDMKLLATVPASLLNYVDDSNGASKYYSICALYANGEGSHTTPVFVQGVSSYTTATASSATDFVGQPWFWAMIGLMSLTLVGAGLIVRRKR